MPDPSVIANTSPLLYLHQIDCLHILQTLYRSVIVPPAVREELSAGQQQGFDVPDVARLEWIQVGPVASAALVPAVVDLGRGEAEVLALGMEVANSLLLLDDQLARRIADLHGLRYTGTLGILVKAKQAGVLPSVKAAVAGIRAKGMWLSSSVVDDALRMAGEHTEREAP
jgi:predicted nucleic acid-binding protein